ncbi:MAG: hypothetical protein ACKOUM_10560, partial [Sphingopyxis sp.]
MAQQHTGPTAQWPDGGGGTKTTRRRQPAPFRPSVAACANPCDTPLARLSLYVKVKQQPTIAESPSMPLPAIFDRLRLPVIGSPLFIISTPDLVIA